MPPERYGRHFLCQVIQNSDVGWIVYNDEGHGRRHQEDNIDFWKHVEAFLDTNLKTPH